MMNFWISLYVIIVITAFGSIMIGSNAIDTIGDTIDKGAYAQITRIGSHDQIFPQDGPQDVATTRHVKVSKSAPDEQ